MLFTATTPTSKNSLTINISNIENNQGTLEIGLFNTSDSFLKEGEAFKTISVKAKMNETVVVINNLPNGTYAVSMYHDKNADGQCNRNFIGIPVEPYAFSNNFRPKYSAPKFKDCKFDLSSDKKINLQLKG